MVKATEFVTAKYMTAKQAGDLNGKSYIIESAFREEIGQKGEEQDKLCIRLKGVEKPLPLNQTNLMVLMTAYGDDTDLWINKKITVRLVNVTFNNELVKGIQLEPTL